LGNPANQQLAASFKNEQPFHDLQWQLLAQSEWNWPSGGTSGRWLGRRA